MCLSSPDCRVIRCAAVTTTATAEPACTVSSPTLAIVSDTACVPRAATVTLDAISWVAACCCSIVMAMLVACVAHLRGYDLDDQRVRNAILTCTLGEDTVTSLLRKRKLPTTPMGMATAPAYDAHVDRVIAAEVTSELLSRVAGKRMAATVARRVPVVGGVIGAGADGFATWQIGRYADRELLPRTRR